MEKLQCESCGGVLTLREDVAVCEFCGAKYTRDDILHMQVELVKGDGEKNRLLNDAQRMLDVGAQDEAEKLYQKVTQEYPTEYRGWFGLWYCRAVTNIKSPHIKWMDIALYDVNLRSAYKEMDVHQIPLKPYADICFPTSFEKEYSMAISLAPEAEKERVRQIREEYYEKPRRKQQEYDDKVAEYAKEARCNASKLYWLWKKHNYDRAFWEVMAEQCSTYMTIYCFDKNKIHGYIDNCITFYDDLNADFAIIKTPPERMEELETLALQKHKEYLKKLRCPHCKDHPRLTVIGACPNALKYGHHPKLKP